MTSLSPGSKLLQTVGVAMQAEEGKEQMRQLQEAFGQADIKHDGKLSKKEFMSFLQVQGGLGIAAADQRRLFDLLSEKNALDCSNSFVATAVAASGYGRSDALGSAHQVEVYVPSTANVNEVINETDLLLRVEATAVFLTGLFYGASVASPTTGYYKADDGELVREKTYKVYSFTTLSKLHAKNDEILNFAQEMCVEWSQECIAVVIDGTMHFVYPPDAPGSEQVSDGKLIQVFFSRIKRHVDIDTISARVKHRVRKETPKKN